MHMLSKKDLNSAELETARASRRPTTVITAYVSIDANEGATVYVRDLDLFSTAQLLEDTPPVLSPTKLCEDHGCWFAWIEGEKPNFIKHGKNTHIATRTTTCPLLFLVSLSLSTGSPVARSAKMVGGLHRTYGGRKNLHPLGAEQLVFRPKNPTCEVCRLHADSAQSPISPLAEKFGDLTAGRPQDPQ